MLHVLYFYLLLCTLWKLSELMLFCIQSCSYFSELKLFCISFQQKSVFQSLVGSYYPHPNCSAPVGSGTQNQTLTILRLSLDSGKKVKFPKTRSDLNIVFQLLTVLFCRFTGYNWVDCFVGASLVVSETQAKEDCEGIDTEHLLTLEKLKQSQRLEFERVLFIPYLC